MGFALSYKNRFVISMPGIPYEMKPMFENYCCAFYNVKISSTSNFY